MRLLITLMLVSLLNGCSSVHLGYFEMIVPIPWGTTPISLIADVGKHETTEELEAPPDEITQ